MLSAEDAQKLANIALTVDGGCGPCIRAFTHRLNEAFQEYIWIHLEPEDDGAAAGLEYPGIVTFTPRAKEGSELNAQARSQ